MIEKLRDEIIESHKARTELMKWKLILVAAIGNTLQAEIARTRWSLDIPQRDKIAGI